MASIIMEAIEEIGSKSPTAELAPEPVQEPVKEEFDYTKATNFTSEVFKIELSKLPRFFGYGECKKLLSKKLKLKPHKINVLKHSQRAYVTFKNEEDKAEALKTLQNYTIKGKQIEVKTARPKQDAMALKRHGDGTEIPDTKKPKFDENLEPEELLKNTVIPWWKISYEEQLKEKQRSVRDTLHEIRKQMTYIKQLDLEVFRWFMQLKNTTGLCCPVRTIFPSPVTENYRNKCGFTIGKDISGKPMVGFRLGKYREKVCAVEAATCLVHVPERMKQVAASFTRYIPKSKLTIYNLFDHTGHWKQITVRTTLKDMIMVTISLCKQELSEEELSAEQRSVVEHFESENVPIDTLLFQTVGTHKGFDAVSAMSVVTGTGIIYEKLFDLTFQISPDAFFQCNTLAAEVLYNCVREMALKTLVNGTEYSESDETEKNKETILLDVCCGTGTIGVSLAGAVKRVIGLDNCAAAVEDAQKNVELNSITNAEFHCGKAEDLLSGLIAPFASSKDLNIVAVVDPPRCGLHQKVIKTIRQCRPIKKIVYVSCSLPQAKNNFLDLCRPQSKRLVGLPFKPLLAQPLDLFPHTKHCEVVVLFQRIKDPQIYEKEVKEEAERFREERGAKVAPTPCAGETTEAEIEAGAGKTAEAEIEMKAENGVKPYDNETTEAEKPDHNETTEVEKPDHDKKTELENGVSYSAEAATNVESKNKSGERAPGDNKTTEAEMETSNKVSLSTDFWESLEAMAEKDAAKTGNSSINDCDTSKAEKQSQLTETEKGNTKTDDTEANVTESEK